MSTAELFRNGGVPLGPMGDAVEYVIDAVQRSILFTDVLRKRGNQYLANLAQGEPPVLVFDYEILLDARTFEKPANYALARILPRAGDAIDVTKRPIVVIDPRAGNTPGIGGSKQDSEIGDALDQGHPVYFILFYADPVPGQTLADVEEAEVRFVEHVAALHPDAPKPAVIGNCQAGWAVALLAADRPDLPGPIVLNGAPLSYWSGVHGRNPMRYAGGLLGGIWMSSLLSDLGGGKFDGAWLEANFENLDPANTLWTKQYHLYANVDTEEERYLAFEKWWNSFSYMNKQEMHEIVRNLFVGDKLERGALRLHGKRALHLKDIRAPILLFASEGDNITPPQQALDWILKTYASEEEIKRLERVIVGLLQQHIGHLGIFVGGKIAKKEHKEIIRSIDAVETLPPGLYEMIIDAGNEEGKLEDYEVRFEERTFRDIMALNEDMNATRAEDLRFRRVAAVSEALDKFYARWGSPWIRPWVTELSAELGRQLHPQRTRVYVCSDRNPMMWSVRAAAPVVREHRRPVAPDNPFLQWEKAFSDAVVTSLDAYRDLRDRTQEVLFDLIYSNPWLDLFFPLRGTSPAEKEIREERRHEQEIARQDRERWLRAVGEGGFAEGVIRIMLALADPDHVVDLDDLYADESILQASRRIRGLRRPEFVRIVRDQARLLQVDEDQALQALPRLIVSAEDRRDALEIAQEVFAADRDLSDRERDVLHKIERALQT
jgi:hypothetical protein